MSDESVAQFLSGYFHEDWDTDAVTDADVVVSFRRNLSSTAKAEALAVELENLASKHSAVASDQWLFAEYGCYYKPSVDGLSGSDWLRRLASILRDSSSPE